MRTNGLTILAAISFTLAPLPALAAPRAPRPITTGPMQLNCDMLSFVGMLDKATTRELGPAHTLDAAATVLDNHKIPFSRERGTLTFGEMPKKLLDDLNALPSGEPIILPNNTGGAICVLIPSAETY